MLRSRSDGLRCTLPCRPWPFLFSPLVNSFLIIQRHVLEIYGFVPGIITLQPTSFADPRGKAAGLLRHQVVIFFLGFPSVLLGTFSVSYNKWLHGADHFTTWHGVRLVTKTSRRPQNNLPAVHRDSLHGLAPLPDCLGCRKRLGRWRLFRWRDESKGVMEISSVS